MIELLLDRLEVTSKHTVVDNQTFDLRFVTEECSANPDAHNGRSSHNASVASDGKEASGAHKGSGYGSDLEQAGGVAEVSKDSGHVEGAVGSEGSLHVAAPKVGGVALSVDTLGGNEFVVLENHL